MLTPVISEEKPVVVAWGELGSQHEGPHVHGHDGASAPLPTQTFDHATAAVGNGDVSSVTSVHGHTTLPWGVC